MQTLDRDSRSITIDAPAEVVFDLVSDIHQMARFSPELVSCRWLDGIDRPAVGARFEAVNQVAGSRPWKNRPVVTQYHRPQVFATNRTEPFAGTLIWHYELISEGRTTRLIESYEVTKPITRIGWLIIKMFGGHDRRAQLRRGMDLTLAAIKTAAEDDQDRNNHAA